MHFKEILEYCLSKPGSSENFPFDEDTLVFKTGTKMFALISVSKPDFINLKCDPGRAQELRAEWEEITGAYHMSKTHWNSVSLVGRLPATLIIELIDHSHDLVFKSLKKAEKEAILAGS